MSTTTPKHRRLTGAEEQRIVTAMKAVEQSQQALERQVYLYAQAGARIVDLADVAGVARSTIYAWCNRANGELNGDPPTA